MGRRTSHVDGGAHARRDARRLLRDALAQRRIPRHVVTHLRQRAGQRLAELWDSARKHSSRPRSTASGSAARVWIAGSWQAAVDLRFAAARDVAEDNLAIVARALQASGVPFFVRDATPPGRIIVGVREDQKDGALAALSAATQAWGSYLEPADDGRPRADRLWQAARRRSRHDRWLVYRNHRLSDDWAFGASHACLVEFWRRTGDHFDPPAGSPPGRVSAHDVGVRDIAVGTRRYPSLATFADHRALRDTPFPIDVVYTWVDDSDPAWIERQIATRNAEAGRDMHPRAANASRYRNRDELRFSLRSLELFAPFVRRVFIVTAGQVPTWLDLERPDVQVVDHGEILEQAHLPTFNSHAIEARLHRIDGLAEHYLYFNDDVFLGREVAPTTFFTPNGLQRLFPDELAPIPPGSRGGTEEPVDSAAINARELLRQHLGIAVGRKLHHAPFPQRRSVLAEMEKRFPDVFERTAASRFRHPADVNVASLLSHYYAFATERAVPGHIECTYVNIDSRRAPLQLARLLDRRDQDAFCLNETSVSAHRVAATTNDVDRFLRRYFPVPSRFELPTPP